MKREVFLIIKLTILEPGFQTQHGYSKIYVHENGVIDQYKNIDFNEGQDD